MSDEPHHLSIPPVTGGGSRPRWSVLIPTFNCAAPLEETLRSVLHQDPGPASMEIIVVDDHSTRDDPESVVRRVAGDRVRFIRQPGNVGKVRNYETGLLASRGELIHQLHGDDRVRTGFYAAMEEAFARFPEAGAFFCESFYVNEAGDTTGRTGMERPDTGILENWIDSIVVGQRIQTPSMVLRREVYETLGAFDRRLDAFEDWEMWIRTSLGYPVGFAAEALADYRTSGTGTTARSLLSGNIMRDIRAVLEVIDSYLPSDVLARARRSRSLAFAQYLTQFIPFMMQRREYGAVAQIYGEALGFSVHPRTLYRLVYFTINYRKFLQHAELQNGTRSR